MGNDQYTRSSSEHVWNISLLSLVLFLYYLFLYIVYRLCHFIFKVSNPIQNFFLKKIYFFLKVKALGISAFLACSFYLLLNSIHFLWTLWMNFIHYIHFLFVAVVIIIIVSIIIIIHIPETLKYQFDTWQGIVSISWAGEWFFSLGWQSPRDDVLIKVLVTILITILVYPGNFLKYQFDTWQRIVLISWNSEKWCLNKNTYSHLNWTV